MKSLLTGASSLQMLLLLSTALSPFVLVKANNRCDLVCPIDAPCVIGEGTDLSDRYDYVNNHGDDAASNGMHCDCPPGWTGALCDRKYKACDNQEHVCFHGGECVVGFLDQFGNEQPYCDCSTAIANHGAMFTGKFCETEVSAFCSDHTEDSHHFCVHGGSCNPAYEFNGGRQCLCDSGFEGEHCEFKAGQMPDCTLDCGTSGRCVVGLRSPGELARLDRIWSTDEIDQHMYCECPDTTGGLNCEAAEEPCGDDSCFHGGSCIKTTVTHNDVSDVRFRCDCTTANNPLDPAKKFAGEFCQFPSTKHCPAANLAEAENAYCVNGGECPSNALDGCFCPTGFAGSRCEYIIGDSEDEEDEDDRFEDHPDSELCGPDQVCHNGGICRNGEEGYYCDCSNAIVGTTIYAGASCEYPSTALCGKPNLNGDLARNYFCANGGTCNDHHPAAGCRCSSAFEGLHCEFPVDEEDDEDELAHPGEDVVTPCGPDLTCLHGSTCGPGPLGEDTCDCSSAGLAADGIFYAGTSCEFRSSVTCSSTNSEIPFCVNDGKCPTVGTSEICKCHSGFAGDLCEEEVTHDPTLDQDADNDQTAEQCGDTHCFNGGECVRHDGTEYCDCRTAFTATTRYAGDSCQFPSSQICANDQNFDSLEHVHFCTNHGTCDPDGREFCDCGISWTGRHCEFSAHEVDDSDSSDAEPIPCGDTVCFHDATCVTEGSTKSHCDCLTAHLEEGVFYAGESCQYSSTVVCDNGSFCVNGGKCKPNGLSGCDCHSSWTGDYCDVLVSVDDSVKDNDPTVVENFVKCGDDHCYFGGTCVSGEVEGKVEFECDCSTAYDEDAVVLYAGEFCQYRSTAICPNAGGDPQHFSDLDFCVNGGRCRDDILRCDCPTGYTGLSCEEPLFNNQGDAEDNIIPGDDTTADDEEPYNCHLDCRNRGKCYKGAKDLGDLADTVEHVGHLNQTHHKDYFEHCSCERGYTGVTCEHKVEICGNNEHHCLHGSECVSDDGEHACDCQTADEILGGDNQDALYAGDSCEHAATDICSTGEIRPGQPLYFCVNDGKCKGYVNAGESFPGCDCVGDWTGKHCEDRVGSAEAAQKNESDSGEDGIGEAAIAFSVIIISIAIVLAVLIFMRSRSSQDRDASATCMQFRKRRSKRFEGHAEKVNLAPKQSDATFRPLVKNATPLASSSDPMAAGFALEPDDEPEVYLGPPRDEDGHELHNVDII